MRARSRGDTRPVSEPQIRRVLALAREAGLVDRDAVAALVARIAGGVEIDGLTREQVQDVFDELERLRAQLPSQEAAEERVA
jgi:hypothetical protein